VVAVPAPDRKRLTRDEWVQMAVNAAVEQGFGVGIEDQAVIDFIADAFERAAASRGVTNASAA
jgi:hypothetical protein